VQCLTDWLRTFHLSDFTPSLLFLPALERFGCLLIFTKLLHSGNHYIVHCTDEKTEVR
jgi:hypothetical protein